MEDFTYKNEDVQKRREIFRKDSLENDINFSKDILIIRASLKSSHEFSPMDYVYTIKNSLINQQMIEKALEHYHEQTPPNKLQSVYKSIISGIEHAVTMAISREEDYHVIIAKVNKKDVFKSQNSGEYHYDAEKPLKAISVIDVSAEDLVAKISDNISNIKQLNRKEKLTL